MAHPVLSQVRVLVVDGQRGMRGIVRSLLVQIGIREIVEAGDGEEAINVLVEGVRFGKAVDIVLTELYLPGRDGKSLIEHIRQGGTADLEVDIPIVVLTGEFDKTLLADAKRAGATEVLRKPIAAPELLRTISRIAGIAVTQEEAAAVVNTQPRSGSIRPGASGRMPR